MENFEFISPITIKGAVSQYKKGANNYYLAGGTDLIVLMREGILVPEKIIDLKTAGLPSGIKKLKTEIRIGALATLSEIEHSSFIRKEIPFLAEAAGKLGSPLTRNRATIGGNLCNASPAADTATPLIAVGAKFILSDGKKERRVKAEEFFKGVKQTVLKKGELLKEIVIPRSAGKGIFYKKSRIKLVDLATVNMTVYREKKKYRIVIGACHITPLRIRAAEEKLNKAKKIDLALINETAEIVVKTIKPISDMRGSAEYRKQLVETHVARLIGELAGVEV
ncbi:xanthine dehydrogenase family protein subunit M [bacterium]|nr:xanthine dehydrogenase family protein subunit M [bacterium]